MKTVRNARNEIPSRPANVNLLFWTWRIGILITLPKNITLLLFRKELRSIFYYKQIKIIYKPPVIILRILYQKNRLQNTTLRTLFERCVSFLQNRTCFSIIWNPNKISIALFTIHLKFTLAITRKLFDNSLKSNRIRCEM